MRNSGRWKRKGGGGETGVRTCVLCAGNEKEYQTIGISRTLQRYQHGGVNRNEFRP